MDGLGGRPRARLALTAEGPDRALRRGRLRGPFRPGLRGGVGRRSWSSTASTSADHVAVHLPLPRSGRRTTPVGLVGPVGTFGRRHVRPRLLEAGSRTPRRGRWGKGSHDERSARDQPARPAVLRRPVGRLPLAAGQLAGALGPRAEALGHLPLRRRHGGRERLGALQQLPGLAPQDRPERRPVDDQPRRPRTTRTSASSSSAASPRRPSATTRPRSIGSATRSSTRPPRRARAASRSSSRSPPGCRPWRSPTCSATATTAGS